MQIVNQWESALAAACKPVPSALPFWSTYGVPPTKIITTVCSGTLPINDMFGYAALAVVFAIVTVAVPNMAAELVGGTVGLALGHAFEAAYTAQTIARIVNPITSAIKGTAAGVAGLARGSGSSSGGDAMSAAQNIVNQQQKQSAAEAAANTATKPLNPFDGQPPGYNYVGGPRLPAPPANGSGSGGAALEYQPGRPGQHTKDIAIDVTQLQNGKGKGDS